MTHLSHGIVSSAEGRSFRTRWNTANTSAGSSTSTQVMLPLISAGTYNFVVDWGDGSRDTITVWNAAATTHTYGSGGTYTIKIVGQCEGWSFANTGDRLKLLDVQNWGTRFIPKGVSQFYGCSNMLVTATDSCSTVGVTSTANMFRDCTAMTSPPNAGSWVMAAVTNTSFMFQNCTAMTSPPNMASWSTGAVTNMNSMFQNCAAMGGEVAADSFVITSLTSASNMFSGVTLSTTRYNALLVAWEAQTELTGVSFHGGASKHSGAGTTARNVLTGTSGWTITDAGPV